MKARVFLTESHDFRPERGVIADYMGSKVLITGTGLATKGRKTFKGVVLFPANEVGVEITGDLDDLKFFKGKITLEQ